MSGPFYLFERIGQAEGDERTRQDDLEESQRHLLTLGLFATARLGKSAKTSPKDALKEKVRHKNTFPQLVLFADVLAAYSRITVWEIS